MTLSLVIDTCTSCRSTYTILQSSLATIFACTWIAAHPNIPSQNDSRKARIIRRLGIFLIALLAPEFIVTWAVRQWLAVRVVMKASRRCGLGPISHTHAFFIVMGGYLLVTKDNVPIRPLTFDEIRIMSGEGDIDFPPPLVSAPSQTNGVHDSNSNPDEEILDKSKSDILAKTLVLFQTSWFLLQVLARVVAGLPITTLEILTVAFAVLNFLTYTFWWWKPVGVECPIRIVLKGIDCVDGQMEVGELRCRSRASSFIETMAGTGSSAETDVDVMQEDDITQAEYPPQYVEYESTQPSQTIDSMEKSEADLADDISIWSLPIMRRRNRFFPSFPPSNPWDPTRPSSPSAPTKLFSMEKLRFFIGTFIISDTVLVPDDGISEAQEWRTRNKRFPSFYSGATHTIKQDDTMFQSLRFRILFSTACQGALAILFGGLHTLAWSSHFPSIVEKMLWRISSLLLIVLPSIFTLEMISIAWSFKLLVAWRHQKALWLSMRSLLFLVYIISRILLICLAFGMLRSLEDSDSIFNDVVWTSYIPHF